MSTFSKLNALFLALALGFSSFCQLQDSTANNRDFPPSGKQQSPLYFAGFSPTMWGIINFSNSSSSLLNFYSNQDSEEDQKNNSRLVCSLESCVKSYSSIYLFLSKTTDSSPSIREIIYPFHFYF